MRAGPSARRAYISQRDRRSATPVISESASSDEGPNLDDSSKSSSGPLFKTGLTLILISQFCGITPLNRRNQILETTAMQNGQLRLSLMKKLP